MSPGGVVAAPEGCAQSSQVMLAHERSAISFWEALLTPVTYVVVGWLKRAEGVDVYDDGTDFTPFGASV